MKPYYFQHDYSARTDPKLQDVLIEHGVAGIGVFWCIVEQLYEQGGVLPLKSCKSIAFALHMECKVVESVVNDFDLFQNDGENFWSNSILTRLERQTNIAAKRKAAAIKRWQSAPTPQPPMQMQYTSNANAVVKEKKRNNIKENISSNEDIKEKTQKRFCPPTFEEVKSYISENELNVDAQRFVDFYESKGWLVGKVKMKDWKAAVRGWSTRQNQESPRRNVQPSKNVNDEWQ